MWPEFYPFSSQVREIINVVPQSERYKFGSMCLLCACLKFFSTKFFPFSFRQKLDNFFSWIIFLRHSSTPGRKIMWGHGLCWPALKENMQNWTPCGVWVIPQILNSLSIGIWVGLVGIPVGCHEGGCAWDSAERTGDGLVWVNKGHLLPAVTLPTHEKGILSPKQRPNEPSYTYTYIHIHMNNEGSAS